MVKVHTRVKRKLGLSTRYRHDYFFHPTVRKKRPKTFKTEKAANVWASDHGLKPGQYSLKNVKRDKRFQIVMHDVKNKHPDYKEHSQ